MEKTTKHLTPPSDAHHHPASLVEHNKKIYTYEPDGQSTFKAKPGTPIMSDPPLVEDYQSGSDDDQVFFPAFFDEQGAFPTLPGSFPTAHTPVPGSFPVWQPEEPADERPTNPQQDMEEDSNGAPQQQHQRDTARDNKPVSRRKKRSLRVSSVSRSWLLVLSLSC